ncbi:hypothetical protein FRB99_007007, partial [Tulasnella sp. 403]
MASASVARRTNSTTSLSRYYHELSDQDQSSLDFCNAFWGLNDCGVDVLFARMRGAARTMEEVRSFWKERVAIEEDYAKRLGKLAKLPLGRDEIGDLRAALDALRIETDKQSATHLSFAQNMRRDLEQPAVDFIGKQTNHKKTFQTTIEKSYKAKQTQEKYVEKAREKYEADCVHINSYTAQSTLLQGKELDKIHLKLERAQQTVQANERDYQNFARALSDTAKRWEGEWKVYCDQCQDLEDERIEFIKDNAWTYANAVSTCCVADDESCERIRVVLEQVEAEKDMENFVREYGTGPVIPEPIPFISYKTSAPPSRPGTRMANFLRSSIRAPLTRPSPSQQQQPEEPVGPGAAGIGAAGGAMNRKESRSSMKAPPSGGVALPGLTQSTPAPHSTSLAYQQTGASQASTTSNGRQQSLPTPRDPRSSVEPQTMLSVGGNAYAVDPNADPQSVRSFSGAVGDDKDPIAQQLDALKKGGGVTRNGVGSIRGPNNRAGSSAAAAAASSSDPPRNRSIDYRDVANSIVGAHPASRSNSPQPHAAMMQSTSQPRGLNEVHQQAFPGERRLSINRDSGPLPGRPARSPSPARDGFAGIGAQGRSPSPQPFQGPNSQQPGSAQPGPRPTSTGYGAPRATSPSSFGIALDASGHVAHDSMAEEYTRRNSGYPQGQYPTQQQPGYDGQYSPQPSGYQAPRTSGYASQGQAYPTTTSPANGYPAGYAPSGNGPTAYNSGYPAPQQSFNAPNGSQPPPAQPQPQRAPSPAAPVPSATAGPVPGQGPPTGQFTDDGSGVLFYVKALYDYTATIPEEFDFQAGDIIAVTATPDDGWWSGVLLDDTRRVPGRTTFPSNF